MNPYPKVISRKIEDKINKHKNKKKRFMKNQKTEMLFVPLSPQTKQSEHAFYEMIFILVSISFFR